MSESWGVQISQEKKASNFLNKSQIANSCTTGGILAAQEYLHTDDLIDHVNVELVEKEIFSL